MYRTTKICYFLKPNCEANILHQAVVLPLGEGGGGVAQSAERATPGEADCTFGSSSLYKKAER